MAVLISSLEIEGFRALAGLKIDGLGRVNLITGGFIRQVHTPRGHQDSRHRRVSANAVRSLELSRRDWVKRRPGTQLFANRSRAIL